MKGLLENKAVERDIENLIEDVRHKEVSKLFRRYLKDFLSLHVSPLRTTPL